MDARGQTATGPQEVDSATSRRVLYLTHTNSFFFCYDIFSTPSKSFPEVGTLRERRDEGEKGSGGRYRKESSNRIITLGTSLKGKAVGGPKWALLQHRHTIM